MYPLNASHTCFNNTNVLLDASTLRHLHRCPSAKSVSLFVSRLFSHSSSSARCPLLVLPCSTHLSKKKKERNMFQVDPAKGAEAVVCCSAKRALDAYDDRNMWTVSTCRLLLTLLFYIVLVLFLFFFFYFPSIFPYTLQAYLFPRVPSGLLSPFTRYSDKIERRI